MAGRIMITGDKHGAISPLFGLAEKNELFPDDILIIAGDASYVWDSAYPVRLETLEQVFPGTIAFIDGNHENYTLLNGFETTAWCGGKVHQVSDRIYHLMRGELYSIYGNNIFTFGGARSVDKDRRVPGLTWWEEEEPSPSEVEYASQKLMAHRDKIDYVITHETPLFVRPFISREKAVDPDYHLPALLDEWYMLMQQAPRFKKWYFGHMHVDQVITPQVRALHNNILLLGEDTRMRWA